MIGLGMKAMCGEAWEDLHSASQKANDVSEENEAKSTREATDAMTYVNRSELMYRDGLLGEGDGGPSHDNGIRVSRFPCIDCLFVPTQTPLLNRLDK